MHVISPRIVAATILSLRPVLAFQPALRQQVPFHGRYFVSNLSASSSADKSSVFLSDDSSKRLIDLAKDFIRNKNAAGSGESSLDGVFEMCSPSVELYGLIDDDVRPGFTAFFEKHPTLYHELMEEPTVVGLGVVQYPFVKQWRDETTGKHKVWKSIDADKPRNKVERLLFDRNGQLEKVSVVEAEEPLE